MITSYILKAKGNKFMGVTTEEVDGIHVFFDSKFDVIMTVQKWFLFLFNQQKKTFSPLTIKQYASVMKWFLNSVEQEYCKSRIPVENALSLVDRDFINKLYDAEKHKPATLKNKDNIISSFYNWYSVERRIEMPDFISPYAFGPIITKRTHNSISKFLLAEEVIQLINALNNEAERCLVHFMCDTGLRISEIEGLTLKDVPTDYNQDDKYIIFKVKGAKGFGGNKKERQTYISRPVLSRLKKYHNSFDYKFASKKWKPNDPDKPMFLSCNGIPVYRKLLSSYIDRAVKKIGLNKKVSPHWLRHTAAMSFLKAEFGESFTDRLLLVMNCLGHESAKTTSEYIRIPHVILTENNKMTKYDEAKYIYEKTMNIHTDERRGHNLTCK